MSMGLVRMLPFLFMLSCVGARIGTPEGTFYGVLPCADCHGLEYELTLNRDGTYAKRIHHVGKGSDVISMAGTYEILGKDPGKVVLSGKGVRKGDSQFSIIGAELEMLDSDGDEIETGFRELYVLRKEKPLNFMDDKPIRYDIRFKGQGNEPFWLLEMDSDHNMTLQTMDSHAFDLEVVTADGVRSQDVNAISYLGEKDGTTVRVMIFRESCDDTMADTSYSHKVRIEVRKDGKDDFAVYEGCGDYRGEARLNDIWALVSINDVKIEDKNEIPSIEFQVAEGKVFGFTGCNRMSGGVDFFDGSLKFGTLGTTRRACIEPNVEDQFLQIITNREMSYAFEGLQLTLNAGEDTLVFKKVD